MPLKQSQPAAEAIGRDFGLGIFGRLVRVLDDERLDRCSEEARTDGRAADADDMGKGELLSPSSLTTAQPRCGCFTVAEGK